MREQIARALVFNDMDLELAARNCRRVVGSEYQHQLKEISDDLELAKLIREGLATPECHRAYELAEAFMSDIREPFAEEIAAEEAAQEAIIETLKSGDGLKIDD